MSKTELKPPAEPKWWLNTYFLFAIVLAFVALLGFAKGAAFVRDPGQPDDNALAWWYLLASVLFFINGYVSHQATTAAHRDAMEGSNA